MFQWCFWTALQSKYQIFCQSRGIILSVGNSCPNKLVRQPIQAIGQWGRNRKHWTYSAARPIPAPLPWCARGRRSWRWGRVRRARRRPCCPWRRRRPRARGRWRTRRSGASAWTGRAASWRPWPRRRARTPRAGSSRPPPPPGHLRQPRARGLGLEHPHGEFARRRARKVRGPAVATGSSPVRNFVEQAARAAKKGGERVLGQA